MSTISIKEIERNLRKMTLSGREKKSHASPWARRLRQARRRTRDQQ